MTIPINDGKKRGTEVTSLPEARPTEEVFKIAREGRRIMEKIYMIRHDGKISLYKESAIDLTGYEFVRVVSEENGQIIEEWADKKEEE